MRQTLLQLERALVKLEEAAVFGILVLLVATLSLQIASRFLFKFPLDWTEELARVGQLWLVFIGAAVGAYRAEHFVVEIFMQRVAFPGKALVARLIDALVVGFFLVLAGVSAWHTAFGAIQQLTALRVSVAVGYAALPIGCALMAFHFAMAWIRPLPGFSPALEAGE
ncbi:MAG TPA: TRAP transporter small permease subunit [Burkholderiales bacterium]|nr:TRAP transporter small permease subunit [Burkholderiales bacterium]